MRYLLVLAVLLLVPVRVGAVPTLRSFVQEPNGSITWTFTESVRGRTVLYPVWYDRGDGARFGVDTYAPSLDGTGTRASTWLAQTIPSSCWLFSIPTVDGAVAGCGSVAIGVPPGNDPCGSGPPPPARLPRTIATSSWPGPAGAVQVSAGTAPASGLQLVSDVSTALAQDLPAYTLWHPITSLAACPTVVDSVAVDEHAFRNVPTGRWRIIWVFDGPALSDSTWTPFVPTVP